MPEQQFTTEEIANEEWRPVPGFEWLYSVSNIGRVKRTAGGKGVRAGHILKVRPTKSGHLRVMLCRYGITTEKGIHQLVMLAFVGPYPKGKDEINHIDETPSNNRLSNLEYLTHKANVRHSIRKIQAARFLRAHCWQAKLSPDDIRGIRELGKQGVKRSAIAKTYQVTWNTISSVVNGTSWKNIT